MPASRHLLSPTISAQVVRVRSCEIYGRGRQWSIAQPTGSCIMGDYLVGLGQCRQGVMRHWSIVHGMTSMKGAPVLSYFHASNSESRHHLACSITRCRSGQPEPAIRKVYPWMIAAGVLRLDACHPSVSLRG